MPALTLAFTALGGLLFAAALVLAAQRSLIAHLARENARLRTEARRREEIAQTLHRTMESYMRCEDGTRN